MGIMGINTIDVFIQSNSIFTETFFTYRKISPGLIDILKHIFGDLHLEGAYIRGRLIFRGNLVLVFAYSRLKNL